MPRYYPEVLTQGNLFKHALTPPEPVNWPEQGETRSRNNGGHRHLGRIDVGGMRTSVHAEGVA